MKHKKHPCRNAAEQDAGEQVRCCCGKLLAKQTDTGIVLKCTRCKREIIIDFSQPDRRDGADGSGRELEWREVEMPVRRFTQGRGAK